MAEEANDKVNKIIGSKDNNEKDRKKSKEFFQTEKVPKTATVTLFYKSKK